MNILILLKDSALLLLQTTLMKDGLAGHIVVFPFYVVGFE